MYTVVMYTVRKNLDWTDILFQFDDCLIKVYHMLMHLFSCRGKQTTNSQCKKSQNYGNSWVSLQFTCWNLFSEANENYRLGFQKHKSASREINIVTAKGLSLYWVWKTGRTIWRELRCYSSPLKGSKAHLFDEQSKHDCSDEGEGVFCYMTLWVEVASSLSSSLHHRMNWSAPSHNQHDQA